MNIQTILHKIVFFTLILSTGFLSAQVSNLGELYISENTIFSSLDSLDNKTSGKIYNDGDVYFYNHLNNDGIVDFISNTGTTNFVGTDTQKISGVNDSYFYNLLFNNSSTNPFQLYGTISVSGENSFEMGIVDLVDFGGEFYYENDATHINASNDSHINGPVHKMGNTNFDFPIGDNGYYMYSRIQSLNNNSVEFISDYFFENSGANYSHQNKEEKILDIDTSGYWTIDNISEGDQVLLTLNISDKTISNTILEGSAHAKIGIVRWDEYKNVWVNEEGTFDPVTMSITALIDTYGVFTFARVKDANDCLVIYNEFSPNGDGIGDTFTIECLDSYPNNTVAIFNRWGNEVFKTKGYKNNWEGTSTGKASLDGSDELPVGVYYYVINLGDGSKPKVGWLYLNR